MDLGDYRALGLGSMDMGFEWEIAVSDAFSIVEMGIDVQYAMRLVSENNSVVLLKLLLFRVNLFYLLSSRWFIPKRPLHHAPTVPICLLHTPIERTFRLEKPLDRLQRPITRLRVKQKHDRNPEQVQCSEQEITAAFDTAKHDGIHKRRHPHADSPPRDPKAVALCAEIRGK